MITETIKNELEDIIIDLEYAAFNLCDKKVEDLPFGLMESTGADDTLLLAIVRLKNIVNRSIHQPVQTVEEKITEIKKIEEFNKLEKKAVAHLNSLNNTWD